jgi:conserved oligomeric Golgi complex subunit 4
VSYETEILKYSSPFGQTGLEQLFNQLVRPKLRQFVIDMYKDVSYNLDQDAYTTAEYNDVVRKRFIRLWTTLLDGFKVGINAHPDLLECGAEK